MKFVARKALCSYLLVRFDLNVVTAGEKDLPTGLCMRLEFCLKWVWSSYLCDIVMPQQQTPRLQILWHVSIACIAVFAQKWPSLNKPLGASKVTWVKFLLPTSVTFKSGLSLSIMSHYIILVTIAAWSEIRHKYKPFSCSDFPLLWN